jgi:peptidoglycan/xylan/chitin deacetylase (PgdA/CDA1 family)
MSILRAALGNALVKARADLLFRGHINRRLGNPLRVLSGHRVVDATRAETQRDRNDLQRGCLTLASFSRRIEHLARWYQVISLAAVADSVRSNSPLPPNAVVLTFDDGFDDVFTTIYPALKKAGMPFTVFLASGFIGRPGMLTAARVRDLAKDAGALITWGAHGESHRPLTEVPPEEAEREIAESKTAVENLVGQPVTAFCYPDGKYNPELQDVLRRRSLTLACATGRKLNTPPFDVLALQRIPFEEEPFWRFAFRVAGRV